MKRPVITDVSRETVRQWAQFSEGKHAGWSLCVHEGWLDQERSRIVLIQSPFLASFGYPTGDHEARKETKGEATAFALRNEMIVKELGNYQYFACPNLVGFSAPLKAAGWVHGEAAQMLYQRFTANDATYLNEVLGEFKSYCPKDYSKEILENALAAV